MYRYALIKKIVESAGSRFFSVCFIKKNGDRRIMSVQQAALAPRCKGESACESAKRAVAARARNHPNLLNVYSVDSHAIRSINMDSVEWIRVDGKEYKL